MGPKVYEFITDLPSYSLICDLGCGNAKNAIVASSLGHSVIASDISMPLVKVCIEREPGLNVNLLAADCLRTPFRSDIFDATLSIAVLHHLSSEPRRLEAIREAMRILRVAVNCSFMRGHKINKLASPVTSLNPRMYSLHGIINYQA